MLPRLDPPQELKLKQLTVMTLAETAKVFIRRRFLPTWMYEYFFADRGAIFQFSHPCVLGHDFEWLH